MGAFGGAGLLLRYDPPRGASTFLLQHRAGTVGDEPGSWGLPGGAIRRGESPEAAADREAHEEIWPVPSYRITGNVTQDCGGGWQFRIIEADVDEPVLAYCVRETEATGWFTLDEMERLPLHPGFRRWVEEHRRAR